MNTQASEISPKTAAEQATNTAPAALTDLIAAGLVSHELIGDPVHIGAEAPALGKLCGMIAGPIYRIDPFHYAFRAGPGDLSGRLGALAPADWTAALDEAMRAAFGAEAIWLNATDLLSGEEAPLDHPLLFLRAHAAAVTEATPGLQAVINARYATETAQLTARLSGGVETGSQLADRLAGIEQRQRDILQRLEVVSRPSAEPDPAVSRLASGLAETLAVISRRLDNQSGTLSAHLARVDGMAGALSAMSQRLDAQGETTQAQAARADGIIEALGSISQRLDAQAEIAHNRAIRVEGINGALASISQRLDSQIESGQAQAARAEGLAETLGKVARRLDAQAETGRTSASHVEGIAEALAAISQRLDAQSEIGQTRAEGLAESLASISRRLEAQVGDAARVEGLAGALGAITQRLDRQAEHGHIRAIRVENILESLGTISQRLDAEAETGQTRAERVEGIAASLSAISQRLDAQVGTSQAQAARVEDLAGILTALSQRLEAQADTSRVESLAESLAAISQRLDVQAGALDSHMTRADGMAERLAELAALSGGPAIFQETLGLTLAEFLARLEFQAEQAAAPARAPRFS